MTFYPVSEWPHIAILDPRTGERLVTWSQVPDAATFCDLITEFLTLHPGVDVIKLSFFTSNFSDMYAKRFFGEPV
jgi:hypothetical protein